MGKSPRSSRVTDTYKLFRKAVLTSQARQIIEGSSPQTVEFLRLPLQRMPQEKAVRLMLDFCFSRRSHRVYFVNAHTVVTSRKVPELSNALQKSSILLPDGSGVLWSSRLLGKPIKYNLNGTDLIPAVCEAGASKGLSVYLLGAKPGIADAVAKALTQSYPGLVIAGIQHGYYDKSEIDAVLEQIRTAQPHLLLVAMGVPLQELWIDRYADQLPSITCVGVGGLFDFVSERVVRAPYPVRVLGLEWLWRLLMEPKRLWYRYTVGNVDFIRYVIQDWLTRQRHSGK